MRTSTLLSVSRIRDLFRLARILSQDRPTQEDFAKNVLGIASVHLSYIEAGRRLPSEDLVVKLLAHFGIESESQRFLEMLARERASRDFIRDLMKIYEGKKKNTVLEKNEGLYKAVTRAISILSEGEKMNSEELTRRLRKDPQLRKKGSAPEEDPARAVEHLISVGLVSRLPDGSLALKSTHYKPGSLESMLEYLRSSFEFFLDTATKASLGKVPDAHLYDIYLDLKPEDLAAFQRDVYEQIMKVAERYRSKRDAGTRFVKVLVASGSEE